MMEHERQGRYTRQAHKGIPEGHFEEEQGRGGFFGPVSHLIKPRPSTRWIDIDGELRPHLFDLNELPKVEGVWQRLLFNQDLSLYWFFQSAQGFNESTTVAFRNADGDTLYFCHRGQGKIYTEFGSLLFEEGSYILIPKCVTHSIAGAQESVFLVIENRGRLFREPDRGMIGKNGFYDPTSFGRPNLESLHLDVKEGRVDVRRVRVKRKGQITTFHYDSNYLDTVGWKGDYYPVTLHIRDLMPLLSARVHLPPSAHTTFVADRFVVCTFLPRPLESDEDALKVPFYHQNIDYDEVLFYHSGDFFSRDNLKPGMMSFHPVGFPHGPHPKAIQAVKKKTHTDEVAVMVDSYDFLEMDELMSRVERPDYWKSWQTSV